MNAPITYIPGFVDNPDSALVGLQTGLEWERRADAPRCEYYCNDFQKPYVYGRGKGTRLYEPRPMSPTIKRIRERLEEYTGSKFEVCFLNRYLDQSDHLGWHADDSPEMDDHRPIAIVSLGVEREIWFRKNSSDPQPPPAPRPPELEALLSKSCMGEELTPEEQIAVRDGIATLPPQPLLRPVEKLVLGHGSLCLMSAGMQQDGWQHRIPKASFKCGERVSLTFRGYVEVGQ